MNAFTSDLVERLLWSIPFFALIGVGLWMSAKRRAMYPKLAGTFSLAFILFIVQSILGSLSRAWMLSHLSPGSGLSKAEWALRYGLGIGFSGLLLYAAWAVLLLAIHRSFQELARLSGGEIVDVRKES
ncbi:MAG TPA: hypothetical protein VJ600_08255 [Holophagaceae bacterium]|nr:hypothetical protein [Holophagaceae bacterium]